MRNIREIEKNLKISGNVRNPVWFTRQVSKGRIKIGDFIINEAIFTQFKTCIKVISEVYENNWDINFKVETNGRGKIIIEVLDIHILFPEITITNSRNNSHLIKDLVVSIRLLNNNNTRLKIGGVEGGRLTISFAEYQSNYFHSHLSVDTMHLGQNRYNPRGNVVPFFHNFCTGSGEINMYMSDLNGDGITEERFLRFAMQIMTLVNWESIEGTPHRYMNRINTRPTSGAMFSYADSREGQTCYTRIMEEFKNKKDFIPEFNIVLNASNSYEIILDDDFKKFIANKVFTEGEKAAYFCIPGSNGTYYKHGQQPGFSTPPILTGIYLFRGVERAFVVEPNPDAIENGTRVESILHPRIIEYIKNKLQDELNKKRIRQSTIDRYEIKPDNARESIQSDPVPVQGNS